MSKRHNCANQMNPEVASNRCENAGEVENRAAEEGEQQQQLSEEERFEQELNWCVEQLELGLETQRPDSRQAMEAVKILKILTSPKAPLVKKRQAMRNTFGDYRSKMKAQEQKSAASVRKVKMASGCDPSTLRTQFVRKSSHVATRDKDFISEKRDQKFADKDYADSDQGGTGNSNNVSADKDYVDSDQGGTGNSNNVNAEILDSNKAGTSNSNHVRSEMDLETSKREFRFGFFVMGEDGNNTSPITGGENSGNECTITDFFKFKKSDNSFRFGFSLLDGDA